MTLTISFRILITLLLATWIIASCKHDPEISGIPDPQDTTNNTTPCDPDTAYFVQQILPLFQSGCALSGCHDVAGHQNDVILDSYANIIATGDLDISEPTKSEIYEQMIRTDDERMPPPPAPAFSSDQLALIAKWIGQGAKNNSCIECDTSNVAYSSHIKPLIQNNCFGCHNGPGAGGGIGLATYDEVKAIADNGKFIGVISHLQGYSPMPKNGARLSDCQINMVRIWIYQGAPDN